jgi:hypothetical protein
MRPSSILIILALFALSWPVFAAEPSISRQTPSISLPVIVESSSDILPLPVVAASPSSLRELQTTYSAVESVRVDQREKYAQIQKRFQNASASEQPLLSAQLSQQRQRVYLSTLNTMVVIYQRADYLVDQFDAGLLSVRSKYRSTRNTHPVSSFDSRMDQLENDLASLKQQSSLLSQKLSAASSSINLRRDLGELKGDLSSFLNDIKSFSSKYRSLVQDVVSRS